MAPKPSISYAIWTPTSLSPVMRRLPICSIKLFQPVAYISNTPWINFRIHHMENYFLERWRTWAFCASVFTDKLIHVPPLAPTIVMLSLIPLQILSYSPRTRYVDKFWSLLSFFREFKCFISLPAIQLTWVWPQIITEMFIDNWICYFLSLT